MKRDWEYGICRKLIDEETLQKRIRELGEQITNDYKNTDETLIVVGLLKGSLLFMADLIREIKIPLTIDFMEISSYGDEFETSREVRILKDLEGSIMGKNILVVEDIIDSGLKSSFSACLKMSTSSYLLTIVLKMNLEAR